jgi:hypothetical protein
MDQYHIGELIINIEYEVTAAEPLFDQVKICQITPGRRAIDATCASPLPIAAWEHLRMRRSWDCTVVGRVSAVGNYSRVYFSSINYMLLSAIHYVIREYSV